MQPNSSMRFPVPHSRGGIMSTQMEWAQRGNAGLYEMVNDAHHAKYSTTKELPPPESYRVGSVSRDKRDEPYRSYSQTERMYDEPCDEVEYNTQNSMFQLTSPHEHVQKSSPGVNPKVEQTVSV